MSAREAEAGGTLLRLLVVEDEPVLRNLMVTSLAAVGCRVTAAADGVEALEALRREEFDVVVTDLRMPRLGGIELLRALRADGHDAEVIVVTGHAEIKTAIEALKLQAYDYVTKPFDLAELEAVVSRAAEHRRLTRENRLLRRAVAQREPEPVMLGRSPALGRVRALIERAAPSQAHVLVLGESGSGKELVAQAIHRASPRRDLPFLALNCAALPNELLESELFGHEKGAFTGAAGRRQGLFELVHGGTLFLDEVAEMSLPMQAKLLRAIDRGEIRRLGGERTLHVDVRIIAATNRDLRAAVAAGDFRQDLYYRLGVVVIEVPPLRERREDLPLLVEHFAARLAPPGRRPVTVTPEALGLLARYDWPGNVRELRNVVERVTVLAAAEEITAAEVALHLPLSAAVPGAAGGELPSLAEVEQQHILRVLQHTGGSRTRAARILGLDPKTLYNKLKAWGAQGVSWEGESLTRGAAAS